MWKPIVFSLLCSVPSITAQSSSQTLTGNKFISIVGQSEGPQTTQMQPVTTDDPFNSGPTFTYSEPGISPTSTSSGSGAESIPTETAPAPISSNGLCIGNCIPTIYTTGFHGFTTVTTTSTKRYLTTSLVANDQTTSFSVFPVTSATVMTVAFSGVPRVSYSTYIVGSTVTDTETALIGGSLTTFTATSVRLATTSVAFPVGNAAAIQTGHAMVPAAVMAVAGAAIALL
jgi:hypothetical protein